MRKIVILLAGAGLAACGTGDGAAEDAPVGASVEAASLAFDGADYGDDKAAKAAHGDRMANVLLCRACHGPELTGSDMGQFDPELAGIYPPNLTISAARFDDAQLMTLLREGVHPTQDRVLMMPSKTYQHVADADLEAIIAYLRTLEPAGEEMPPTDPNPELAKAIEAGEFPTAAQEVAHYRGKYPVDLGEEHALGRYVATAVCADCHGSSLDGSDAFAPSLYDVGLAYDSASLTALLETGTAPEGRDVGLMGFIGAEMMGKLTENERGALVDYLMAAVEAGPPSGQ
ncbi:cytochrome c4 [Sphingomicrobium aestuariivivum]|uniref:cytochrome c4 n=1 Tax=Sphingomicrobium aestuariivivum TaxID=1582356 RepID=UPI001FD7210F|nr:cytochrome c [Sphingomicrobium aestuariivivum]MCJ8190362.1 cytochrome c [Sphingomicrobium aestuariivivum]